MSSVNPPTGKRQVPVTNWRSRTLFSLSISLTTCNHRMGEVTVVLLTSPGITSPHPSCGLSQRIQGPQSPPGLSGCPPARTTGSACCSWCNACRWYSSASHSGQFPACRTASAGGGSTKTSSLHQPEPHSLALSAGQLSCPRKWLQLAD